MTRAGKGLTAILTGLGLHADVIEAEETVGSRIQVARSGRVRTVASASIDFGLEEHAREEELRRRVVDAGGTVGCCTDRFDDHDAHIGRRMDVSLPGSWRAPHK